MFLFTISAAAAFLGASNQFEFTPLDLERVSSVRPICPLYQYPQNMPAEEIEEFCRQWERENRAPPSGTPNGWNPPHWKGSDCSGSRLCKEEV